MTKRIAKKLLTRWGNDPDLRAVTTRWSIWKAACHYTRVRVRRDWRKRAGIKPSTARSLP